ncbi:SDR family oxidoreductase [Jiangella endophytica]|uniref:SDR family oxidoreductase n=1 Tax=Jiangella endophytica TaxID=1623398 RepID=UPI000E34DEAD|nr:SDR family oxidoreductase [Jiangella endophytica]
MGLESFQLTDRVALITGAGSGIGQAIAVALAEAGADVVGVYRRDADDTAEAVESTGRRFVGIQADLADVDAHGGTQIIGTAVARAGHLDILVNNAGIIARSPGLDLTLRDWRTVLDTNLTATFLLSQAAGRHFAARDVPAGQCRGKIVNIASLLSFQGGINVAGYTASKSGLAGLTRALANEWASLGINVNAIAPGYIETAATHDLLADPDRSSAIGSRIPAGRWGRPGDVAGAAVFLASAASAYVHGVVLPVDGGWLSR